MKREYPMDKQKVKAINSFLAAAAALLLAFKLPEEVTEETPEAGDTGSEPGDTGGDTDLGDLLDSTPTPEAPPTPPKGTAPAEPPKPPKKKPEPAPAEKKPEPPPAPSNPDAVLAEARAAAVAYAGKHGKEALRGVLNGFTKGTIKDVEAAKLPALIAKLKE